jgi:hypothetical protein
MAMLPTTAFESLQQGTAGDTVLPGLMHMAGVSAPLAAVPGGSPPRKGEDKELCTVAKGGDPEAWKLGHRHP